jgi:hypothetical protein
LVCYNQNFDCNRFHCHWYIKKKESKKKKQLFILPQGILVATGAAGGHTIGFE